MLRRSRAAVEYNVMLYPIPQASISRASVSTVGERRPDSYSTIAAGDVCALRANSRFEMPARKRARVIVSAPAMY